MKTIIFLCLVCLFVADASAQSPSYVFDKKIALPGDAGYDYLSIDHVNHRLYVSHGTTVNVIDLDSQKPVGVVDSLHGVHGIAVVNDLNRGFISDGRGNAVVVFDLKTLKTVAVIPLSGKNPDAITYDPYSKKVFAFNGGSNNASVIDPKELKETSLVDLGAARDFPVPDGREKFSTIWKIRTPWWSLIPKL